MRNVAASVLENGIRPDGWERHVEQAWLRAEMAMLVSLVPDGQLAKCADLGSGTGRMTGYLASRADGVYALEFLPALCEFLRARREERGWHNVHLVRGSADALPYAADSLGCVAAVQCIGHLIDTQGFFEEARRVLLPGGTLLLSTGLRRPWHRKRHAMRHRLYWAARPLIDVWRGRQPVEPVWRWPAHGLWCLCSGSRRFWLETRGYADHTWQGLARFGETAQLELIRAVGITEQATCHEWFPERSGLPHLPQCRVAVAAWRKPSA